MKYVLEICHEGECIERREQDRPFPNLLPGDQMYIEFENSSYSDEHGFWWTVKNRSHLLFSESATRYTLQVHCEPNPSKGKETDITWLDNL